MGSSVVAGNQEREAKAAVGREAEEKVLAEAELAVEGGVVPAKVVALAKGLVEAKEEAVEAAGLKAEEGRYKSVLRGVDMLHRFQTKRKHKSTGNTCCLALTGNALRTFHMGETCNSSRHCRFQSDCTNFLHTPRSRSLWEEIAYPSTTRDHCIETHTCSTKPKASLSLTLPTLSHHMLATTF